MIDLCLFDFDNTLLFTSDLESIRHQGVGMTTQEGVVDPVYAAELKRKVGRIEDRLIYTQATLLDLRKKFPNTKFGLFTRAPFAYFSCVDNMAYPDFFWDTFVCYESIANGLFKPNGYGVSVAMADVGVSDPSRVVLVGDESVDVRAAYNAGCYAVIDQRAWPDHWETAKHWSAVNLVPDAIINSSEELTSFLEAPPAFAPTLERSMSNSLNSGRELRFDDINHFFPPGIVEGKQYTKIACLGRHFSKYQSLDLRRQWHELTHSVHALKEAVEFPVSWCDAVYAFIKYNYPLMKWRKSPITVAAIPSRPERTARMQFFVKQLESYFAEAPPIGRDHEAVEFSVDLLGYADGVRSHSREYLTREERFENVRVNLFVNNPSQVIGRDFVIIDDVATTGATLMLAETRLKEAGARNVRLVALAKNIGEIL